MGGRSRSADAGPTVEFFDAVRQVPIGAVEVGSGTERAAFSPDGKTLAVVTSSGDIVVGGRRDSDRARPGPAEASVDAIAFDPGGSELLTAEHAPTCGSSWCPATRSRSSRRAEGPHAGQGPGDVPQISAPLSLFAMAFAPDGSWLVTTRAYGPTVLWNPGLTTVRRFAIGGQGSPSARTALSPR